MPPYLWKATLRLLNPESLFWSAVAGIGKACIPKIAPNLGCANMEDAYLSAEYEDACRITRELQKDGRYPIQKANGERVSIFYLLNRRRGEATARMLPMVMKVPSVYGNDVMLHWPPGVLVKKTAKQVSCFLAFHTQLKKNKFKY